jgi:hypothetical protein
MGSRNHDNLKVPESGFGFEIHPPEPDDIGPVLMLTYTYSRPSNTLPTMCWVLSFCTVASDSLHNWSVLSSVPCSRRQVLCPGQGNSYTSHDTTMEY